jgi:uncharacterized protein with von Willebrand factor type A (vWA) domain
VTYLSRHAINADRWDRRTLKETRSSVPGFGRARSRLGKAVETGADAFDDAFWLLHKANPELMPTHRVRPSHIVNRAVIERLAALPALRRLRDNYCVGDPVQSASSAIGLASTLEAIFERLAFEQELAKRLQALDTEVRDLSARVLRAMRDDIEAERDEDEDQAELLERLSDLTGEHHQLLKDLEEGLEAELDASSRSLREAVTTAADEAAAYQAQCASWGVEPGQMRRLPADERLALAASLNTPRMREISALFGRLSSVTLSQARVDVDHLHEEIVDLELGGNLNRVVPSEFLLLGDPVSEQDFMARLSDGGLLQYAVRGSDTVGRGGIIICLDSSLSMEGDREYWAKAFMLVLLHLAHREGRRAHVIHFGSPGEVLHQAFEDREDFTPVRIVEAAEVFLAGGTDYHTPLDLALDLLREEHDATGRTQADIVFVTDGECYVDGEFLDTFRSEMARMGARAWGVDVTGHRADRGGPLAAVCGGQVCSIRDLRSGRDISELFRSVA